MNQIIPLKLCLVTDIKQQSLDDYKKFLLECVRGGVTCVQLRAKHMTVEEFYHWAVALKSILQPHHIPLIINDNLEIAQAADADGIHLGQSDISPLTARNLLGKNKIIGWSIETMPQLRAANQLSCIDYVAASAVFPSKTKLDCKTIWQLAGLKKIAAQSVHPVVAIGGIYLNNVQSVIQAGAKGVAVVSEIHDAREPAKMSADLLKRINDVYRN